MRFSPIIRQTDRQTDRQSKSVLFLLPSYIVNRRGLPEVFSDRARLFAL